MTKEELQALGITPEDVLTRVCERICDSFVSEEKTYAHDFQSRVERAVKDRVDAVLTKTVDEVILPKVSEMVEQIQLQETNRWGEPKANAKLTFKEYLTQRVDLYIREQVDFDGKAQAEDSYAWRGRTTRIAYMIDKHIHYTIEKAMKDALATANSSISKGLSEAVTIALKNIQVNVKTEVKTP